MTTPPSQLVLLADLSNVKLGSKVRFAGRISSYDPRTGLLTLTSPHSSIDEPQSSDSLAQPIALVEVSHVLTTASSHLFDPGAVVSVVGYVINAAVAETHVQALMLWDASGASTERGSDEYRSAVAARQQAMQLMEKARRGG